MEDDGVEGDGAEPDGSELDVSEPGFSAGGAWLGVAGGALGVGAGGALPAEAGALGKGIVAGTDAWRCDAQPAMANDAAMATTTDRITTSRMLLRAFLASGMPAEAGAAPGSAPIKSLMSIRFPSGPPRLPGTAS